MQCIKTVAVCKQTIKGSSAKAVLVFMWAVTSDIELRHCKAAARARSTADDATYAVLGDVFARHCNKLSHFLSIDLELGVQLQNISEATLQVLEQGLQKRCWQLERTHIISTDLGTTLTYIKHAVLLTTL